MSPFDKIKSAPTEADAQKTQTPIVAQQFYIEQASKHFSLGWNLHFYQIQIVKSQKGYNTPNMRKKACSGSIKIVEHNYYNTILQKSQCKVVVYQKVYNRENR